MDFKQEFIYIELVSFYFFSDGEGGGIDDDVLSRFFILDIYVKKYVLIIKFGYIIY